MHGRPGVALDAAGAVHVAVRHRTDEVWERVYADGTWSDWQNLGGTVSGSPTLLAAAGRIYLFAVAADNRLWQCNFVAGAWGGWFPRSEFATAEIQGAIGAEPGPDGSASVVLLGVDGRVRRTAL